MFGKRLGGKGQISLEYLVIFSITFVLLIPLIIIFVTQTQNMQEDITNAQLDKLSSEIDDAVSEVYYLGPPAQKTIRVTFPSGIQSVDLESYGLVFNVQVTETSFEFVKETRVNLTGSLRSFEGPHVIVVKSYGNYVQLTDK